jgi:glutamyl-Q tRNA(Asp) synthetase
MNDQGQKLSKQNLAQALDPTQAPILLQQALHALNQPEVDLDRPEVMLQQAVAQWNSELIPHSIELEGHYL